MESEEDRHTKDVVKEAIKEALMEWLNEKFLSFGRWTFLSMAAVLLVAIVYTILHLPGFRQAVGLPN